MSLFHLLIFLHCFGPHCRELILLQKEDPRSLVVTQNKTAEKTATTQ